MGMVFCHGCGKQIHESAITCPQCGALQAVSGNMPESNDNHWTSITSFVSSIIAFMVLMSTETSDNWDSDTVAGGIFLAAIPIFFGILSLNQSRSPRWMAATGVIVGVVVLLASLGSM